MDKEGYTGIDFFRFIASLLVVAIHTSPLGSFSETGDFVVTRILARVAVPFFFMTSGFFLISRYADGSRRLWAFVKRTALLYGAAALLYLPVNVYNGYFGQANLLPNLLKDIAFDGVFYHLWYLPASIIGAAIAWCLVRKCGYRAALAATAILYLIGLLGDSYYGLSERAGVLKGFYDLIFQIADYTRNGVFFAPVFFVLGGYIAEKPKRLTPAWAACGFGVSLALLFCEALLLRAYRAQRHDSMYLFLLPCVYFLFSGILRLKGKRIVWLRTASLVIYLLHPMAIMAVRLFAKRLHLESLLIENSLLHFMLVCLFSVAAGMATAALWGKYRPKKLAPDKATGRAYIEIDLGHLEHNAKALRGAMPPGCEMMAVIKARAYGHGAYAISTCLEKSGVRAFAVATIDEAVSLRRYGIRGEILILGYTDVQRARELKKYDLMQTAVSLQYARALNGQNLPVKVHIKIDTGMHRLGIPFDALPQVKQVFGMRNLKICGVYTHLCCSDSLSAGDVAFTQKQISRFYRLIELLKRENIAVPKLHIQSSYGLLNYPGLACDYVRTGIALYGVLSTPDRHTILKPDLRPVLSLKARVAHIQEVRRGESAGYGRAFTARRDSRLAILPVGYGDGLARSLSCGRGFALIGGRPAPIAGRVCMDQLAVDITDIEGVSVGDIATLIDTRDGAALSADMVADRAGSISNELLCRMGERLPVVVKRGAD